ncbi:LysR family transcriptional regulator [Pararhodobacter oceanensis]|uniref:HTH lysR-type domain-containing protein n=1 Tax=Pararhodobacter oceanensis TaxID=2172121 RepID=A0A2T8HP91_9RHOB|nr:LysR family transcriptional regulator [Pararhodobacter oceanensis]PVH27261.1 hypothetical protein DDE20_18570 [Pararhodobacter oceanensis]
MSFFRRIQVFRTVMMSATLADAASRLFLTQPAVTKQLRSLEAHLGVRLFERSGHRLQPNRMAQALFRESESAVAEMEKLEGFALSLQRERERPLRIVVMPMIARLWLPERVSQLFQQMPETRFEVRVALSEKIIGLLDDDLADIGIGLIGRRISTKNAQLLLSTDAVAILPMGHHLSGAESISALDLADEKLILLDLASQARKEMLSAFASAGLTPNIQAEVELEETAVALVEAGQGVSVIDSYTAEQRRRSGAKIEIVMFEPRLAMQIGLMHNNSAVQSEEASRALRILAGE